MKGDLMNINCENKKKRIFDSSRENQLDLNFDINEKSKVFNIIFKLMRI